MKILLWLCFAISFFSAFVVMPYWMSRARRAGLIGKDMNKRDKRKLPEVGGVVVVAGFIAGIFAYIAIKTFYFQSLENVIQVLAVAAVLLIITLVGFIDDILGWKIGLRQYQKPLLCLMAAVPLMVINAGQSIISLPFIGRVDIGLLYPLVLVPIGIMGAANGFNMLAGYNGLEAGMGIIILSTMALIIRNSSPYVALIALCGVAALLAFLFFNWYPAKIFPGDTLTYSIGALIASVAILGNVEKAGIILFIPYFIELVLKARGKMRIESFALPQKDGSLETKKTYSLCHVAIRLLKRIKPSKKVYERDVVLLVFSIEIMLAIIAILVY